MMNIIWVVLLVALTGSPLGHCSPLRSTPQTYPHDGSSLSQAGDGWGSAGSLYAAVPALALTITAVVLLIGCTWCYRHKDCKLFAASATHLHDGRRAHPPDSGFSEPVNNNINEDNNNGPISLREMQNIANNNATAYIVSENEERNRVSRESVVEFEPLPTGIRVADPLEHCADWFGEEDLPRSQLQYLREIGRGWFGRVVEGEIEDGGTTSSVAVKILNQNASLEDKARFLDEAKMYRDVRHENILAFITKCLQEDPWILIFELCTMDLEQYLVENQSKMDVLNESGVTLRLMSDISAALAHLHSRGYLYGAVNCSGVRVRGAGELARAVLGRYQHAASSPLAPEAAAQPARYTASSEVWALGALLWQLSAGSLAPPAGPRAPPPAALAAVYLYQVMQLCWNSDPEGRPTSSQVHALINHLYVTHRDSTGPAHDDGYGSSDFEERWQRLKPNTIPKVDEHVAIVHAPSTSMASHFTGSEQELNQHIQDSLSVDMDTAVSRSSSILSDKDMSIQIKSESLTNLHGSLEDVRNIYLTHNETAALECHQGNISLEDSREKEQDRSDASMDPWLKDIIAGSQDDVSYYKDVSDVIKNLDNILNSEKTSSSESSHQASPSRDNLSLDCKKDYPMPSSMVKSPGIRNFQNILDTGFGSKSEDETCEDDIDQDTIGTLSHSFERHSEVDTTSQHTLENLTPDTPIKDIEVNKIEIEVDVQRETDLIVDDITAKSAQDIELPNDRKIVSSDSEIPKLKELCVASIPSASNIEELNVRKDCQTSCDSNLKEISTDRNETKSIEDVGKKDMPRDIESKDPLDKIEVEQVIDDVILPEIENETRNSDIDQVHSHDVQQEVKPIEEISVDNIDSDIEKVLVIDLISENPQKSLDTTIQVSLEEPTDLGPISPKETPEPVQSNQIESTNKYETEETEILRIVIDETKSKTPELPPEIVQNNFKETTNVAQPDEDEELTEETVMTSVEEFEEEIVNNQNSQVSEENVKIDINDETMKPILTDITSESDNDIKLETSITRKPEKNILNDVSVFLDEEKKNTMIYESSVKNIINAEVNLTDEEKAEHAIESKNINVLNSSKSESSDEVNNIDIPDANKDEVISITNDLEKDIIIEEINSVENLEVEEVAIVPIISEVEEMKEELSINTTENIDTPVEKESHETMNTNIVVPTEIIEIEELSQEAIPEENEAEIVSTHADNVSNSQKGEIEAGEKISETDFEIRNLVEVTNIPEDISVSTQYFDPPSFRIKDIDNFLHMERVFNSQIAEVVSSTPLASDSSKGNSSLENSIKELSETKVADIGVSPKLEPKFIPDNISPFESPTKSHHTDTYDENSSVVLGPFENCTLEVFKGAKTGELDIPKEELLAFSSNFSEINLETPSPLRDSNFLNEVPDIMHDDLQFDDIESANEKKSDPLTETENTEHTNSGTEKRVSPLTPPNSPGVFLASTSQQTYYVDIDLTNDPEPSVSNDDHSLQNQIELQITSKLAMAENENNLNLEYSGPLTVVGLVSNEEMVLRESDALPESYLAGNGGSVEDLRENLTLDEECVQALRNELELKLPLAQVAAIEPPSEHEWSGELPPPPEVIVSYPGALSPIAEETGQQLSAYENDMNWNLSTRTESSESYPEPCNNSTDDVTELPTGAQSGTHNTYTIQSRDPSRDQSRDQSLHNTYTVHRDIDFGSSREITMSVDSLNASPLKKPIRHDESPVDDKTYTKEEEKESLERISQVSPFLLSPTTDTSAPEVSDTVDNATGVSTLSKTTLPTDAKLSKPSETQCLSKATSIDSWCSNDTLYNVEENFDDLAMDSDVPEFEPEKEGNSESTDTLTHNEDEKEVSHCSTYIIHDSKSDACETFSPDSITANDNYTYTKVKTENAGTTPSAITKSDVNDSTKNTTKDLAYETLMSGIPSYSNCTTEVLSGFEDWKVPQPELVRKSPMMDNADISLPDPVEDKVTDTSSPQLAKEPSIKKFESVDISCLQDSLVDSHNKTETSDSQDLLVHIDSPNYNYKSMAPSVTSTPITDVIDDAEHVEAIPMKLPEVNTENSELSINLPNFQTFQQSAEIRAQDLSSNASNEGVNQDTEVLLEGDSKTLSGNSNRDSLAVLGRTPTYSDFESSAVSKPQDMNSKDKSSQSMESGISSEDFQNFETSVRSRPQDLSSLIDASSLLLKSERVSSELAMASLSMDRSNKSESRSNEQIPPNVTNLNESHSLVNYREPNFLINFDADDETEQPHSFIVTETTMEAFKDKANTTFETDARISEVPNSHDPNTRRFHENIEELLQDKINGEIQFKEELEEHVDAVEESPKQNVITESNQTPNTSKSSSNSNDIQCNGGSEKFATVQFINESFEELIESNVDDTDKLDEPSEPESLKPSETHLQSPKENKSITDEVQQVELTNGATEDRMTVVTDDFLQNEKKFCQHDSYLPMLSDIRFTGPASEIMSTSFTGDSPTEPTPDKRDTAADLLKEWDSDSDSHTSNSSSGEFIWKDGDGHETSVVPSTHFDHQRTGEPRSSGGPHGAADAAPAGSGTSDASADSGSGSEGDEVEFVPSSWDCRAAPAKSSLRSLEQATPDHKKRVVFKRQKYHCVYEYPREVADIEAHSPAAYLPDLSTYSEWDPSSVEEAELGYGQLFGAPSPLDLYPLRAGIAFGADYDEDFFISSSARPFESLGIMSTTSQFFPGKHVKPSLLERDLSDDITEDFPPPPSPLPSTTLMPTRTPSLDFTTPDSGVEDITPGSTTDEDFKKKLPETELTWRPVDSASSSESVSPSSPGGEALGGLRHTRDKLKLDLPPSPHIPSPRHNRVFNFVLDKPKRREERATEIATPLVMTDETPIVTTSLPLQKESEDLPIPEPTFSTFGKSSPKVEPEQKLILTDEVDQDSEVKVESPKVVEAVKGEGTVLDSGDEDSGIESSSKATLERNKTNVS